MKIILIFIITLTASNCLATGDKFHLNKLNFCKISKKAQNDYEPEEFNTSNNLLRKTGEHPIYCGEKIIIHGRVLDQNCVPVPDAKVYLWQVNCKGKYPYQPLRNVKNKILIQTDEVMTFTGNGIATTNNMGEFYFVTVYPKAIHGLAPHVNIRAEHMSLGKLQTRIILGPHKISDPYSDPKLRRIVDLSGQEEANIYDFDIVLPGEGLKSY